MAEEALAARPDIHEYEEVGITYQGSCACEGDIRIITLCALKLQLHMSHLWILSFCYKCCCTFKCFTGI